MEGCHSVCKLTETVTLLLVVCTLSLVRGDTQWPLSPDVLSSLPPCELDGLQLKHPDVSCIFIAKSKAETTGSSFEITEGPPDSSIRKDTGGGASLGANIHTTHGSSDTQTGNFWIALIAVSIVLVLYIILHCVYIHCYASKKIKHLPPQIVTPAIVFSDNDIHATSIQMTPLLPYRGGPKGIEGQSSIVFYRSETNLSNNQDEKDTKRKRSYLKIPDFFNAKTKQSSKGGSSTDTEPHASNHRGSLSSICIVPSVILDESSFASLGATSEDIRGSMQHMPILILPTASSSYVSMEHDTAGHQLKDIESSQNTDELVDDHEQKQDMLTGQESEETEKPPVTIQIGGD